MVTVVAQGPIQFESAAFNALGTFFALTSGGGSLDQHSGSVSSSSYFITFTGGPFHKETSVVFPFEGFTGTVTSMTGYYMGQKSFTITGLNVPLSELVAAVGYPNTVAADMFKGNDIFYGTGHADQIRGWAGNDRIFGRGGGDQLDGDSGNDLIDGGAGFDQLYGGRGQDKFQFATALAATNIDTVADFQHGIDKIVLSHNIFGRLAPGALSAANFRLGVSAHDANDFIVYDHATGNLYYDRDGSGPRAAIQFATIDVVYPTPATVSAADFLIV